MSRAALSSKYFAAYLLLLGALFVIAPNPLLSLFRIPTAGLAPAGKHYAGGSAGGVSEAANRDGHRKFSPPVVRLERGDGRLKRHPMQGVARLLGGWCVFLHRDIAPHEGYALGAAIPRHPDPAVWNCWADGFGSDF